jgi:hypothetical protein
LRPEFFPAPVPIAVAVPADRSLLRFKVALLRSMLRYVSRKLLILKQCYMLRFFENGCESPQGQRKADSANRSTIYSRKATHTIIEIL